MPIGLIGKKLGMSQIFDETGRLVPVTLIEAGPCPILQVKTLEKDGYHALQVGFEALDAEKRQKGSIRHRSGLTLANIGHCQKAGAAPHRVIREMRVDAIDGFSQGQTLKVDLFAAGEKVDVTGICKGRGYQGTIRRFHTNRGPETHGSMYHRRVGSNGGSSDPARTFKGKVMPGHLGNTQSTVLNLRVVKTDPERNLLFVRGAIPGANNGYVVIRKAIRSVPKPQKAK